MKPFFKPSSRALLAGGLSLICFYLFPFYGHASSKTDQMEGGKVTYVAGNAILYKKSQKAGNAIRLNGQVREGDKIRTGKGSRVEILMADGSVVRLGENSVFDVNSMKVDSAAASRNIDLKLSIGRVWAKVRGVFKKSSFNVSSNNAVAGVRGTTYRLDVSEDNRTVLKVYEGVVDISPVARRPEDLAGSPYEGLHEVPGPREVTLSEWQFIVSSMMTVTISPDGIPTKPRSFTLEEDMDSWVKWNLERDANLI